MSENLHNYHKLKFDSELDVVQIIQTLWQQKVLILLFSLSAILLAFVYLMLATPMFSSNALLKIEEKNNPLNTLFQDLPISSNLPVASSLLGEVDILTSRRIFKPVIDELKLDINVSKKKSVYDDLKSMLGASDSDSWVAGGLKSDSSDYMIQLGLLDVPNLGRESDLKLSVVSKNNFELIHNDQKVLEGKVGVVSQANGYRILVKKLNYPVGSNFLLKKLSEQEAIKALKDSLNISVDKRKNDGIIRLSLENPSPYAATLILNTIIKNYVEYNISSYNEVTEKTLQFVEGQLKKFSTDVAFNNKLYLLLLTKAHELRVMKAGALGNVRVVDNAILPLSPVSPRKTLIVFVSGILGLFLGMVAAFLRNALDRSVYDAQMLETNLNLPVYSTIPLSPAQLSLNKEGWGLSENGNLKQQLLFNTHPDDPALEAMRFLRTVIDDENLRSDKHRVIAITGPSPNVGKTFLSTNLACLISELGLNVLLVDADLRRGVVHEYFALEKECGMAEFLTESVSYDSVIKYSGIKNLDIITRGGASDNPSVLMSSGKLRELLKLAREQYGLVIIDTPPALSVTDAAIIARYVDQLLIVIRAAQTTFDEVSATWKRLVQSGKRPTGFVMSGYDPGKFGYSKYHQYGYY